MILTRAEPTDVQGIADVRFASHLVAYRGLVPQVCQGAVETLVTAGFKNATLGVMKDNALARRFYELAARAWTGRNG
jgi:hypothetical protein